MGVVGGEARRALDLPRLTDQGERGRSHRCWLEPFADKLRGVENSSVKNAVSQTGKIVNRGIQSAAPGEY